MFKRSWPGAVLATGLMALVAASPLEAAEESNFEVRTARVGRSVELPHGPGDRAPVSTPTGDDDMPDRNVRSPRGPLPVGQSIAQDPPSHRSWLWVMWARWVEIQSLRFSKF